jgi:hypothetical protein
MVVADDQLTVLHRSTPFTDALAVKLYAPKFSPEIVTVDPPDVAPFSTWYALATGASKLNSV